MQKDDVDGIGYFFNCQLFDKQLNELKTRDKKDSLDCLGSIKKLSKEMKFRQKDIQVRHTQLV